MTKRMLIDATHAEETRVVVLDGNRLEDFDVETSTKRQLKGNIYLAKVVRVEPSLQAAFVEYGGGRHGFLAFGEIHPDYYQIPIADRQRLLEIAAEEAREEEEAEERAAQKSEGRSEGRSDSRGRNGGREQGWAIRAEVAPDSDPTPEDKAAPSDPAEPHAVEATAVEATAVEASAVEATAVEPAAVEATAVEAVAVEPAAEGLGANEPQTPAIAATPADTETPAAATSESPAPTTPAAPSDEPQPPRTGPAQPMTMPSDTRYGDANATAPEPSAEAADEASESDYHAPAPGITLAGDSEGAVDDDQESDNDSDDSSDNIEVTETDEAPPETIGGDSDQFEGNGAEEASRRRTSRMLRNYRIQEVIRRRQILLIQVVKEERGSKGAALTTYISLAGRFCVLMPNSPRGGGISRKITSSADRKRLKEITAELEIPQGMGLIVRTAGAARPKPEIRRDCEYLMRLWDDIRELTMKSMAPALIYEEASLIKRSIRDVYSRDVDEIIVDGEAGWKQAHDFMRMLMPSHAKKVQLWRPQGIQVPLFAKHQVDLQLDAMLQPTVQLRSGGYLVINQTEALVAIDVNSGRSTRERGIEETALKTNLEAADEVARQLRLRDLAGLIVIDFIDMDARRANTMVEKRLKDALKNDRARIQLGTISHFGLLEMSRQRLRPSLAETSFVTCPHCLGLGHVRSVESSAIHVLRAVEEEGSKLRAAAVAVYAAASVVMYILNNKRERLAEIEARYAMRISFAVDDTLLPPQVRIDRLRPQVPDAERLLAAPPVVIMPPPLDEIEEEPDVIADEMPARAEPAAPRNAEPRSAEPRSAESRSAEAGSAEAAAAEEGEQRRRRRRRRRGGRRDGVIGEAPEPGETNDGEEEGDDSAPASLSDPAMPSEATGQPAIIGDDGVTDAIDAALSAASETGGQIPADGEAGELDENGQPKARRRGRRGGRRRRREPGEEGGEPEALSNEQEPTAPVSPAYVAPVYVAPAYVGPTPADPFGNTFDIFDMLEQAEQAAELSSAAKQAAPAEPVAMIAADPIEAPQVPVSVVTVPVEAAPVAAAPVEAASVEAAATIDPVVTPEVEATVAQVAQTVSSPPEAGTAVPVEVSLPAPAEEVPEAAPEQEKLPDNTIKPIVIGTDAPAATPKRGWWRR